MKLLRFELKKMVKQKKYIWGFLIIFLTVTALYSLNTYQRSRLQGRWAIYTVVDEIRPWSDEWNRREVELIMLRDQNQLTDMQVKQLEYSREMGSALAFLRGYTRFGVWENIIDTEKRFFDALESYSHYGGEFTALEGVEREAAIAKNEWMLEHGIEFENEQFPVNQHLFMQQIASILLGIIGLGILLIIFGNSITEEKEQRTWLTLKAQPISQAKLIFSKYITLMLMSILFAAGVLAIGFLIPEILNGRTLNLDYPNVLISGDVFSIINTKDFLIRSFVLFFCSSSVLFSISLMGSKIANKSISLYVLIIIFTGVGYISTLAIESLLNPFYLLNFNNILAIDSLYLASIFFWSAFFLTMAILIPEQEIRTLQLIKDNKPFASGETQRHSSILINICYFEWRKVRREGLLRTFTLSMIVMIFAGYFFLAHHTEQRKTDYMNELQYRIDANNRTILENNEKIDDLEITVENRQEIHDLREENNEARKQNWVINDALAAYKSGDWPAFHRYQLHVNREAWKRTFPYAGMEGSAHGIETLGRFGKRVSIDEKIWLIDKNIQPVFSGEFVPTPFQSWGNHTRIGWGGNSVNKVQWDRENTKIDNSGLFFLHLYYINYVYLIPLGFLLFLIGGGIAKEKGKRPTFNFLRTQPISQQKIYYGKIISNFTMASMSILIIGVLVVLVGTVFNRFGDWSYPVLHYNTFQDLLSGDYTGLAAGGRAYHFITIGRFIINSTILLWCVCLFAMGISIFVSLLLKSPLGVFASTIIILISGYWLNWRKPLDVSYRSPFTYLNIPKIVNGETAARLNEPKFNVPMGVFILLSLTIILIAAAYAIINRERIYEMALCKMRGLKKKLKNQKYAGRS